MRFGLGNFAYLLGMLALAGTGCGSSDSEVSGTVIFDGAPLHEGSIAFIPVDGNTPTAGGSIKDGRYTVRVPRGNMKIQIKASKVVGKKKLYDTPDSKTRDMIEEMLPDKYNKETELEFEVKPGKNTKDFELSSK